MPTQLTAEEMFDKWSDIYHSGSGHGNANEHHIASMKEFAKQESIAFAEWILKESVLPRDTNWFDAGKHYTSKELHNLYEQRGNC